MSFRGIERKVINQFINNYFIETGTCCGDGVLYALDLKFKHITSIDVVCYTNGKFSNNDNVKTITGDTSNCLWDIIKDIDEKITFWLDAHSDIVAKEKYWDPVCPLLEELEQIKRHHIKNHDILIDDVTPIVLLPNFSKQKIEKMIREINNDYIINYVDTGGTEVLLATTTKGLDYGSNANSPAYR